MQAVPRASRPNSSAFPYESSSSPSSTSSSVRRSDNPFGAGIRRGPPAVSTADEDLDEEGDEVAKLVALSKRTLQVQEESADASSRALAKVMQAEQLGLENLGKVYAQGEQLEDIHSKTGETGHKIKIAAAKASYLDKLSDSFLKPIFGGEKTVKPSPPPTGLDGRPLWGRRLSSLADTAPTGSTSHVHASAASAEPVSRRREGDGNGMLGSWASVEDRQQSEMHERRIEDNLDKIGGVVRGIKEHAIVLGQEIEKQNVLLRNTEENVEEQHERLRGVNRKLEKVLRK
ncbi:hypothetical protein HKX48_000565 [Thoreauomyces humboldtii]|nr:hypothetical protein HKX48_000565 [Thoreauomyces humboldtii]